MQRRGEGVVAALLGLGGLGLIASCDAPESASEREARTGARLDQVQAERAHEEAVAKMPTDVRIARASARDLALEPARTDWDGGDAERGEALYLQFCVNCHGAGGRGDGPAAAALNPKPRDFTTGVFYLDADADAETGEPIDLARVIREGPEAFGGARSMPAWKGTFSDDQLRDLVAYVRSLGSHR